MIKYEIKQSGQSYFKKEDDRIFDLTRFNYKKLKIFGITIWSRHDIIENHELIEYETGNKLGFNKLHKK